MGRIVQKYLEVCVCVIWDQTNQSKGSRVCVCVNQSFKRWNIARHKLLPFLYTQDPSPWIHGSGCM
jgi:hypothetical protein